MARLDGSGKTQSDIRASKFRDILNFVPQLDEETTIDKSQTEVALEKQQQVSLLNIHLSPHQPRCYFDPHKMDQLVKSIQVKGILEPLLVRPHPQKLDEYELVAGERRFRAAQHIELAIVPVRILNLTDEEVIEVALLENLQREDLNPVEETEGILKLLALRLNKSVEETTTLLNGMHTEAINQSINNVINVAEKNIVQELFDGLSIMHWQSFVTNRLSLLKLPEEILATLRQGKIEYTKAIAIARVKDKAQRQALLQAAIAGNLSLTQIKQQIASINTAACSHTQSSSLKSRMDTAYRFAKKSKIWNNPKKQKQIEKLIVELEKLFAQGE